MTSMPLVGPGTYLIFGIILAPVYLMLGAWSFGKPIDKTRWLLGVTLFFGITTALWVGMWILTVAIGVIFY